MEKEESIYTKLQLVSLKNRRRIGRLFRHIRADRLIPPSTIAALSEAIAGAPERIAFSAPTLGYWVKHGSQIYDFNSIINQMMAMHLPELKETPDYLDDELTTTYEADRLVIEMAIQASIRNLMDSIEMSGREEGCMLLSLGRYRLPEGLDLRIGEEDVVVKCIIARWHGSTIRGWRTFDDEAMKPVIQFDIEGEVTPSEPGGSTQFSRSIAIEDENTFIACDESGSSHHRDTILAKPLLLIGCILAGSLLSEEVIHTKRNEVVRRKKGTRRNPTPGKPHVRTCKINPETLRRYVEKTERERSSSSTVDPNHVPSAYSGPGYHVEKYDRRVWVREANVIEGEEWIDLKLAKDGSCLVLVSRTCNVDGYDVGEPVPKLTIVKTA